MRWLRPPTRGRSGGGESRHGRGRRLGRRRAQLLALCLVPTLAWAGPELPECEDGQDNDGDGFVDWDGGKAALGAAVSLIDPQCGPKKLQFWTPELAAMDEDESLPGVQGGDGC